MTDRNQTATLADVAQAAGVSTATVSRCLNEPEKVSERTRKKVIAAVNTLGYAPNFAAQAMAARRSKTLGAVIPTMANAIFAEGLNAFQETVMEAGYTLLVATSNYDPDEEETQIRTLLARGAEGLMLIGHERNQSIKDYLAKRNVPKVVAWAHDPQRVGSSIGFDNARAMAAIVNHVKGLGHNHIALIAPPTEGNDRVQARIAGAADAVGHALPTEIATYDLDAAADAFARLMTLSPRPTAVLCSNDVQAAGAIMQARAMGLAVPGDVSVTGFDDLAIARAVDPAITTVRVPHKRMGRMVAEQLLSRLAGGADRMVELETTLVVRGSTAAPQ